MERHVDFAIIGAGSAGLSALRQVKKQTDNFVLIDPGPLGTTCARIGCMPSKALIHVANAYYRTHQFESMGLNGATHLHCDIPAVLRHVRTLRDRFTNGMVEATQQLAGDGFLHGKAVLEGPQRIRVNDLVIHAKQIILATGARPMIPGPWRAFGDRILTSDTIFEQKDFPARMAVIGLGAIGLELGQALSRLGITVTGFDQADMIGGLQDPSVHAAALEAQRQEWKLHLGAPAEVRETPKGLEVSSGGERVVVDKIVVAVGMRPNVEDLGLETLGVALNENGIPPVDPHTSQIGDLSVYLAGDANGFRPLLHEALDEGFIAGRHSSQKVDRKCTCRRVPMQIVFSDPQCVVVGQPYSELKQRDIVIGEASFTDQSRAIMEGRNQGLLRIYADATSGLLLGAEMAVPDGEHLGHLLGLAIHAQQTVFDILRIPFYHPTIEEGLRTALRTAAAAIKFEEQPDELSLCESCPEGPLT